MFILDSKNYAADRWKSDFLNKISLFNYEFIFPFLIEFYSISCEKFQFIRGTMKNNTSWNFILIFPKHCDIIQKQLNKPVWWNWQTCWTQNPVVAIPCGFDPRHRHQTVQIRTLCLLAKRSDLFIFSHILILTASYECAPAENILSSADAFLYYWAWSLFSLFCFCHSSNSRWFSSTS